MISTIVSGGQTGADRAALDVALRHDFAHAGWCTKGRRSEDGPLGGQYLLKETPAASYLQRTEWNVRDSDGTIVFTLARQPTGGSLRTIQFARKHKKPCFHVFPGESYQPALKIQNFVAEHTIGILNIAGSRESKEPGLYRWVIEVLVDAFFWGQNHPTLIGGPGEG